MREYAFSGSHIFEVCLKMSPTLVVGSMATLRAGTIMSPNKLKTRAFKVAS